MATSMQWWLAEQIKTAITLSKDDHNQQEHARTVVQDMYDSSNILALRDCYNFLKTAGVSYACQYLVEWDYLQFEKNYNSLLDSTAHPL